MKKYTQSEIDIIRQYALVILENYSVITSSAAKRIWYEAQLMYEEELRRVLPKQDPRTPVVREPGEAE